jgi:hypothetical protein
MQTLLKMLKIAGIAMCVTACGTSRVVFVDTNADLVRLGADVKGHVYVHIDGEWVRSKNKVHLPEGWIAGPLPKEDE